MHHDREALTAWAETPAGELLASVIAYAFGWQRFDPESTVFRPVGAD